jgi:hypothetical protein
MLLKIIWRINENMLLICQVRVTWQITFSKMRQDDKSVRDNEIVSYSDALQRYMCTFYCDVVMVTSSSEISIAECKI